MLTTKKPAVPPATRAAVELVPFLPGEEPAFVLAHHHDATKLAAALVARLLRDGRKADVGFLLQALRALGGVGV